VKATRLDVALVQRGLASTRTKAQRLIAGRLVTVGDSPATKPSMLVADDTVIDIVANDTAWVMADVGRGATKLRAALTRWSPPVRGALCVDVGASTGGFTQVLLEGGARGVVALDVGHGQLDASLVGDSRVINREGVHAGRISASWWQANSLPTPVSVVVADVSFISLTKIIPALVDTFGVHSHYVLLLKPQFEVGKSGIDQGVVKDVARRDTAVNAVMACLEKHGVTPRDIIVSPLTGEKGNVEYLVYASATSSVHPPEWDKVIPAQ